MSVYGNGYIMETILKSTIDKDFESKGKRSLSSFKRVKISKNAIAKYKIPNKFRNYIDDHNNKGYIYIDNDKLVGLVAIEDNTPDGLTWITAIYVDKNYRGYRLGDQLLDVGIKELKGNALSVAHDNEVALRMYKNKGFKISKESMADVKSGKRAVYFMYLGSSITEQSVSLSQFRLVGKPSKKFIDDHINDSDSMKDFLNDSIRKNSYMFLDENNKVACTFVVFNDGGHHIMSNFEIIPEYRGLGISKKLLDFAVKKKGVDHLWVNEDNIIAKNLYIKYGFKFTGDKEKSNGHVRLYMEL